MVLSAHYDIIHLSWDNWPKETLRPLLAAVIVLPISIVALFTAVVLCDLWRPACCTRSDHGASEPLIGVEMKRRLN